MAQYPLSEPSPQVKPNPLQAVHEQLGATLVEIAGRSVPIDFGDASSEHRSARERSGLIDLSARDRLWIGGSDCRDFLQRMTTNDLDAAPEGQGVYAAMLTPKGKMIADFVLFPLGSRVLADLEPGLGPELRQTLERYIISDDVTVVSAEEDLVPIGLFGPEAPEILLRAGLPVDRVGAARRAFVHWPEGGRGAFLTRTPWTGEEGFICTVEPARVVALFSELRSCGAVPIGMRALRALRIEGGLPTFGKDMDNNTIPLEANLLEEAISTTKGCYVGQEIIARIISHGHVNRRLVGLQLSGDALPDEGARVRLGGRDVGSISEAIVSQSLGRPIALATVHRDAAEGGSRLEIEGGEGVSIGAEVVPLPFIGGGVR